MTRLRQQSVDVGDEEPELLLKVILELRSRKGTQRTKRPVSMETAPVEENLKLRSQSKLHELV